MNREQTDEVRILLVEDLAADAAMAKREILREFKACEFRCVETREGFLAALAAFDCLDELDGRVARYARNRALLLEELPKAGLDRLAPAEGAFYLYADVSDRTDDSEAWCRRLLAETGVAITPGIDFDSERGRRFVRISFSGATNSIAEAARRLRAWRG